MTNPTLRVRSATPADAAPLTALVASSFRETYAPDCDEGEIDRHVGSHFTHPRILAEIEDPTSPILLACDGDELAGYAVLRVGSATDCVPGPRAIEVARLYLARHRIGAGIGPALMRSCLNTAARFDCNVIWLGVWEKNARALLFYRKWGFEEVGTYKFDFGGTLYDDVVMSRSVFGR